LSRNKKKDFASKIYPDDNIPNFAETFSDYFSGEIRKFLEEKITKSMIKYKQLCEEKSIFNACEMPSYHENYFQNFTKCIPNYPQAWLISFISGTINEKSFEDAFHIVLKDGK
jgi:hypothetical protein